MPKVSRVEAEEIWTRAKRQVRRRIYREMVAFSPRFKIVKPEQCEWRDLPHNSHDRIRKVLNNYKNPYGEFGISVPGREKAKG